MKFLFFLPLLALSFSSLQANTPQPQECHGAPFSNRYYLLDVADVPGVSGFFKDLGNTFLDSINQSDALSTILGTTRKKDIFFDFEDRRLLNNRKELYITVNENLPGYRSERESIHYLDFSASPRVSQTFEYRRYKKKLSALDKHALFGFIKRSERQALVQALTGSADFSAETLKENFTVEHEELTYLMRHYEVPIAEITLDKFHVDSFGIPNTSVLFKIEKFGHAERQMTAQEQVFLNNLLCKINHDLLNQYPGLNARQWFGYSDYSHIISRLIPYRSFFKKYPMLYSLGQALILAGIGFLIIYLLLGRYQPQDRFQFFKSEKPGRHESK